MVAITKLQNGYLPTIRYRDLQQKTNSIKFGSIFKLNITSAILDGSHYQIHKDGYQDYQQNDSWPKMGTKGLLHLN